MLIYYLCKVGPCHVLLLDDTDKFVDRHYLLLHDRKTRSVSIRTMSIPVRMPVAFLKISSVLTEETIVRAIVQYRRF
jgi:hypothetical protein